MDLPVLVAEFIDKHRLLSPGEKVVVGVSGGADSCCLLYCLHSLGYKIVIGHLDHQLRPESAKEALFVGNLGKALGLETILGTSGISEIANNGFSIEEAARISRYRFLAGIAVNMGAKKLATGHTANDQIETVLMHFLRGSGSSGLRGMLPATELAGWDYLEQVEDLTLVRPLLDIGRSQTEAYCVQRGIVPVEDASNQDLTYFRNRIRHELIPYLRRFNPGIENVILRTAKILDGEASYLETVLDEIWNLLANEEDDGSIRFLRAEFKELEPPLKRSCLRRAIKRIDPSIRDLGFDPIELAMEFLDREITSHKRMLTSGLEIFHLLDEIVIHRVGEKIYFDQYPQMEVAKEADIKFPSTYNLARNWKLNALHVKFDSSKQAELLSTLDNWSAAIDVETLEGSLSLRTPTPGDRFQPFGMEGSIKLSDFFINHKIPLLARESWPILYDKVGIVWVVGLRISNRVRISSDTADVFLVQVEPPKEESI